MNIRLLPVLLTLIATACGTPYNAAPPVPKAQARTIGIASASKEIGTSRSPLDASGIVLRSTASSGIKDDMPPVQRAAAPVTEAAARTAPLEITEAVAPATAIAPLPAVPKTWSAPTSSSGTVYVKGYYRKDGTYVSPHTRSKPRR